MESFVINTILEAYSAIARYNTETNELMFLKNEDFDLPLKKKIPIHQFMEEYREIINVHPEDEFNFYSIIFSDNFKSKVANKESGILIMYRQFVNQHYRWAAMHLYVPKDYSKENPHVLMCKKLVNQDTVDQMESLMSYNDKIHRLFKANLSTEKVRIVKQRLSESYIRRKYIEGDIRDTRWLIDAGLIYDQDVEYFLQHTDREFILKHFAMGNEELSFFYRRKIGTIFKWVRAVVRKATEYTEQNQVFTYILEDVDSIISKLLDRKNNMQNIMGFEDANEEEVYRENILRLLSYFSSKYIDFYMIDLKKDMYILYSLRPEMLEGEMPLIGKYSETATKYMGNVDEETKKHLMENASKEALIRNLKDKASSEFSFVYSDGRLVKTVYTPIERENGIPTRIICTTVPYPNDHMLKVKTFGNFEVFNGGGERIKFTKKQSKQLLAYLIDKQGFPVEPRDIIEDVLEKDPGDKNAIKYVSRLSQLAIKDLEKEGYTDVIVKEWNSLRVNVDKIDCDYYHLVRGDNAYLQQYHNEYMKEYSWAEETNAEILHMSYR